MPEIIKVARSWINTPWHHHQMTKGVGVDCVGFIRGVAKEVGVKIPPIENYRRSPEGNQLLEFLASLDCLQEKSTISEGNVLVFRVGLIPHHVGFSTGDGMIHADSVVGKVVEISQLGEGWKRRLCGVFEVIP